MLKEQSKGRNK